MYSLLQPSPERHLFPRLSSLTVYKLQFPLDGYMQTYNYSRTVSLCFIVLRRRNSAPTLIVNIMILMLHWSFHFQPEQRFLFFLKKPLGRGRWPFPCD